MITSATTTVVTTGDGDVTIENTGARVAIRVRRGDSSAVVEICDRMHVEALIRALGKR